MKVTTRNKDTLYVVYGREPAQRWHDVRYTRPLPLEKAQAIADQLRQMGSDVYIVEWKSHR